MKSLFLAIIMVLVSGNSFARTKGLAQAFENAKCLKAKHTTGSRYEDKIVGNTLCKDGHGYKIPTKYDEDEMVRIYDRNGQPTGEYQFLEVFCFNVNYHDIRCKKFTKKTSLLDNGL